MAQKVLSVRIDDAMEIKIKKLLELRNIDQVSTGKKKLNRTDITLEALNFYYSYVVGNEDDIRMNKLYESELNQVIKQYMKPLYSMLNSLKFNQDIQTKELNLIYQQLDSFSDEEEITKKYNDSLELDKIIKKVENKKREDIDE